MWADGQNVKRIIFVIIFLLHKIWGHSSHMENKIIFWHHTTEIHPVARIQKQHNRLSKISLINSQVNTGLVGDRRQACFPGKALSNGKTPAADSSCDIQVKLMMK